MKKVLLVCIVFVCTNVYAQYQTKTEVIQNFGDTMLLMKKTVASALQNQPGNNAILHAIAAQQKTSYAQTSGFTQEPQPYLSVIPTGIALSSPAPLMYTAGFVNDPRLYGRRTNVGDVVVNLINGAVQIGTAAILRNNFNNNWYW